MSLLNTLSARKGEIYGGAAILLGLLPHPNMPILRGAEPKSSQSTDFGRGDWQLNNLARRAILSDQELAPHKLGVSVRNSVATIWGTLPSPELASRAEEALRKIPGIAKVVNECRITAGADPFPQALADAVNRARELGSDPTALAKVAPAPPASTMTSRQVVAKPAPDGATPRQVDIPISLTPPPPAAVLLPPIVAEPAAIPEGATPWERARLSEKRFKEINLEVEDGVAKISGMVAKMRDAWDLADKLNAVPGVKRVIIGKIVEK